MGCDIVRVLRARQEAEDIQRGEANTIPRSGMTVKGNGVPLGTTWPVSGI
jgi:hypothetical protein